MSGPAVTVVCCGASGAAGALRRARVQTCHERLWRARAAGGVLPGGGAALLALAMLLERRAGERAGEEAEAEGAREDAAGMRATAAALRAAVAAAARRSGPDTWSHSPGAALEALLAPHAGAPPSPSLSFPLRIPYRTNGCAASSR